MKIAVDARTLGSRPSGVGMYLNDFLKVLMKYREFEFVLLSDVAESEYIRYFMEKGIPVITQGKAVYRSAGVYSYFSFIQKQLNEIQPDLFWEVNTIIPIRLKGNFKTMITKWGGSLRPTHICCHCPRQKVLLFLPRRFFCVVSFRGVCFQSICLRGLCRF